MAEHAADFMTDCSRCPVRARHVDGPESEANFAKLAAVLRPCRFRKGQTLLVEGHLSERVIFVRSGTIRLTRVMPSGEDMLLDFVGPGGVVGLEALFDGEHTATATACSSLQTCAAPASKLSSILPTQPRIALALLRMLRDDVDRLRERVAGLSSWSAEQRVARFLLEMLPAWKEHAPTLTQADMARSMALTPETFSRILSDFRRRRWVAGQGRAIAVLEPARLARLS